ncbi:class I SAM-dependent methyltransferase [bacterium]|jgi:ubiquinone/menaquinone biosynthesis C-methylase UbiE|nr:class I SAM-dependent methyltransferase [bacterium]MBT7992924.1 class I SAM-dependent methyltransferase [bacterium]
MENIEQIKKESIKELGSLVNKEKFADFMLEGFWDSEEKLISKHFEVGSKIIDIGCGPGRVTVPLCKLGNEVIGIDSSAEMIDIARKIALSTNLNLGYRIARATKISFKDDFFDCAIFANNGWGQIPGKGERQRALKEVARVLKPGGKFIFCVHQRYYFSPFLFFWAAKFFEYYFLHLIGLNIKEVDFGDVFLSKNKVGEKLKQKHFVHIAGKWEIKKALKKAGFKVKEYQKMGKLSLKDLKERRGALTKTFNSCKSPVFYVCEKEGALEGDDN